MFMRVRCREHIVDCLVLTMIGIMIAERIHWVWSRLSDDEREVYIEAAREIPDGRLDDEVFFLGHRARVLARYMNEDERDLRVLRFRRRIEDPDYIRTLYLRTCMLDQF